MKNNIICCFVLIITMLISVNAFGKPIDESIAIVAAKNFYSIESHREKSDLNAVIAYKAEADAYYVVNLDNDGFVIVAGDDRVRPVLAYSTEGTFVTENIPDHIRFFLNGYLNEINYMIANNAKADSNICEQWANLMSAEPIPTREGDVVVGPLLGNNKWNQTKYYNNLCPADASGNSAYGGHAAVGCGAMVMGQVMRYWQYPTRGTGTHSYTCNYASYGYGNYGTLSANFGSTTYDFDNMPDRLDYESAPEEVAAVATLLYHCGVSVDMKYGPSASTANSNNIVSALSHYFGYPSTIEYHERGSISAASWISHLKAELDDRAPFFYGGSGSYGGHVWVCDGYSDDDYFHFNWGWGGQQNGYYTITNCSSYGFNSNHAVIVGIRGPIMPYEITVKINPAYRGTVTGDGFYLEGETARLSAKPSKNYRFVNWTENDVEVSSDSVYSFVVTNQRRLVANFEVENSINESSIASISIYPNPTSDFIRLVLENSEGLSYEIFDSSSKLLMYNRISTNNELVDLNDLSSGIYFINVVSDGKIVASKKIIKE